MKSRTADAHETCADGKRRSMAALARVISLCAMSLALCGALAVGAQAATYSSTQTLAVPPASSFAGAGGGDGWAVALSSDQVFNVFHHNTVMEVNCHLQSNASECWPYGVERVYDPLTGANFATSGHPGMYFDQNTGRLYIYGTRTSDWSAGVVCFDTTHAAVNPDPFCGYTQLTPAGQASSWPGWSLVSAPMLVGTRWYSFNYVPYGTAGAENRLLCFDTSTDGACAGEPFAVDTGTGGTDGWEAPSPTTAAIGNQIVVPFAGRLACFDATTQSSCAGSWPAVVPGAGQGYGGPYPLLDATGAVTGVCLPTGSDPCVSTSGAAVPTPAGMQSVIQASDAWNGPAVTIGSRVYVPNGQAPYQGDVECFDYSTSSSCSNFPKYFNGLGYLYTVNPDPQRPTCLWVNADNGSAQIQSFDAYTGGACGQGATRVLTQQFIVPQQSCYPGGYQSIQVVSPAPGTYTSGTVQIDDVGGNPIPGIPTLQLDGTGSVDLSGLGLNNNSGLPQFVITLNGLSGNVGQVSVTLTWTDAYDPACVTSGEKVQAQPTTVSSSLSGGGQSGASILVPPGTAVTDTATLSGANAQAASGSVRYTWYSDSSCTTAVSTGADEPITTLGVLPASEPVTLSPGVYYAVAAYSGDSGNLASQSECGAAVLKVAVPPPTITSADDGSGSSVTNGPVSIAGSGAAGATVQVTAAPVGGGASVTLSPTVTVAGDGTWSLSGTVKGLGLADGRWTFTATESVGGQSSEPSESAGPLLVDTTPPSISIAGGYANGGLAVTGGSPQITIVDPNDGSGNPGSGVDGSKTTYTLDGAPYTPGSAIGALGPHTLVVGACDNAGNCSSVTSEFIVFAYPKGGEFVVGDQTVGDLSKAAGEQVTFWGAQWAKQNGLSGGSAPSAFKGFEDSSAPVSVGTTWTTDPGSSSSPPAEVPSYMGVIVSSKVAKSGAAIGGDTAHVVIVETNTGYSANPGHAGTGTILGSIG